MLKQVVYVKTAVLEGPTVASAGPTEHLQSTQAGLWDCYNNDR